MAALNRKLSGKCTWWSVTPNGTGGDLFNSPVLCNCFWEDVQIRFASQLNSKETVSNAVIMIDRPVAVGDYLAEGDFSNQPSPSTVTGAHKIQAYEKNPDLRSLNPVYRAVL